jgi:hypothetical protein
MVDCEGGCRSFAFVVLFNAEDDVGAVSVVDLGGLAWTVRAAGLTVSISASTSSSVDCIDCTGLDFLADASFSATILWETNLASGVEGPLVVLRRCSGDLTLTAVWRTAVELAKGDDIAGRVLILVGDILISTLLVES